MATSLLLAEDDPVQRRLTTTLLEKRLGYTVIAAASGRETLREVESRNVGELRAVLLDIHLPDMDGFAVLAQLRARRPDLPVVMLTGSDDTGMAVRAIREGARDFIVKPADPSQLDAALKNAIRQSPLARLMPGQASPDHAGFARLVGASMGLVGAVALGRKAAASSMPVLLRGESGVGKELFARALHQESRRAAGPFVAVNCAVPSAMIESALFGEPQGALRRAEGGTLFLDDISELPIESQVRILNILQHREVDSLAAARPRKVNLRLIVASERDLARDVMNGRFREDLYFRLNVLPIHLPPLRERPQDVLPLAEHFLARLAESEGLPERPLSADARQYLTHQHWHGNVRELEALLHRAIVLAEEPQIDAALLQQLQGDADAARVTERRATPPDMLSLRQGDGAYKTLQMIEAEVIRRTLTQCAGNIAQAAALLGVAKSTFYRKIK